MSTCTVSTFGRHPRLWFWSFQLKLILTCFFFSAVVVGSRSGGLLCRQVGEQLSPTEQCPVCWWQWCFLGSSFFCLQTTRIRIFRCLQTTPRRKCSRQLLWWLLPRRQSFRTRDSYLEVQQRQQRRWKLRLQVSLLRTTSQRSRTS